MAEGPPPSLMFEWNSEQRPEFVNYIPKYDCVICERVMLEPVQTECGHRMCKGCIDQYFLHQGGINAPCPAPDQTCGSISQTNIVPDFPTRREILNLVVHCSNKRQGCQETKTWITLNEHLKSCRFNLVDCPHKKAGCKAKMVKVDMQRHLQEECMHRMVPCRYCQLHVSFKELQSHVNITCPAVPGDTPSKCPHCHGQYMRKEIPDHNQKCPQKPKRCSVGRCTFHGTSAQLDEHSGLNTDQHVSLLNDNCSLIDDRLKRMESINFESIRLENGKLKETVKGQQKVMANQEQKILEMQAKLTEALHKLDTMINRQVAIDRKQGEHELKLGQLAAGVGLPEDVRQQIIQYDRMVGQHEDKINTLDTKYRCLEQTSYDGTLVWKIDCYASRKASAVAMETVSMYSLPFYTSRYGYKMCARVYLNGDGLGKGTHMSLFFVLMKGEYDALQPWPFRQKVVFAILDQETGRRPHTDSFRPDPTSTSFRRPQEEMNVATGCPLFLPHSAVENKTYLRDDAIFLKITVDPT